MAYVTHKRTHKTQTTKRAGSWPNSDESKVQKLAEKARRAGKTTFDVDGSIYFICKDGKVRCWDCCPLEQIIDRDDRK